MIQLRVYENTARLTQYWLDLYDSEPIKLTLSIEDITNADATSTYSKAFKVPGTRKNNEFFKQAFEINGVLFDVTVKKPAEILVDGAEFRHGHIRLNKMIKNTELDRYDYELVFLGETRDFSSIIGDRQMCALNMPDLIGSDLGAPLSKADIIQSWQAYPQTAPLTAGLHNGDIIYPLIDHGNTYDDNNVPLQSEVRTGLAAGGKPFTTSTNPLDLNQMYPMIRAKRIWDQIFSDAGYTYSSSFITSNRFHQMYVSAFDNTAVPAYDSTASSEYNFSAQQNIGNGNYQGYGVQYATDTIVDPSSSWSGAAYTANATGQYTFTGSAFFYSYTEIISSWPPQNQYNYGALELHVNGVAVATGSYAEMSTSVLNAEVFLNTGDVVEFFMNGGETADFTSTTNQAFACIASPGNINPASLLECTYKQIDFIKDILLMFRLVLSPDPNNPYNFIVEPWQTYINGGQLYDWSKKLVEEKDVIVEPVFFSQSDNITFTQPTDGDYINVYHELSYKHNWGWLQFDSGNELLKGNREIKVIGIANTPMTQIEGEPNTSTWVLPQLHIHESEDNKVLHLPIKTKTRLLFYNGLKATPGALGWYLADNAPIYDYPLMSQYESWPVTQTSLNLAFSNDVQYWGTSIPGGYNLNGSTLYDSYWSRYISSLYNKYARRVTAYFVLNNIDLNTFSFDDTIFVNGVYYIPEKIIDVQIGAYTEVQVQLLTANDYVPTWTNETLFASATGVNTQCFGQPGSIQVETGGAGPINWTLSNGLSGQYNNNAAPPYSFSIDDVPPGTWTLNLTDAIGRTYTQVVTVPEGTPITSTHLITNSTPGLCDGSVVVTPTGTAPFTIFWSDQAPLAGNFTRENMCCGAYTYFVRDANGCESNQYIVNVNCPPPTYIYEAHEYGKLCNTLSGTAVIVQSGVPLATGTLDTYKLDSVPGCFNIVAVSTLTPVANVIAQYPSCEVCKEPIPIEYYKDWYLFNSGVSNYPVNTTGSAITDTLPNFFLNSSLYDPISGQYTTNPSVSAAIVDTITNEGINPGAYGGVNVDYIQGFSWNNPTHTNTNPSPSTQTNPVSLVGASYQYVIVKQSLFDAHFDVFGSIWKGPYVYNQSNTTSIGTENWQDRKALTLGGIDYYILRGAYEAQGNPSTSQYLSYQNPLAPTPTPSPTPNPSICVLNYGASMAPCIGGTVDEYMEGYVDLSDITPIDATFTIRVGYIPGTQLGNCSNVQDEIDLIVTVYAGTSQGLLTCPQAPFIDFNGATICSSQLIDSPYFECGAPTPTPTPIIPTPTPTPGTLYYYEVENCNGGEFMIIQSPTTLSAGDVYSFANVKGCWIVTVTAIASGSDFPEPEFGYINCSSCLGLAEGEFITDRKERTGNTSPICATLHKYPIYSSQAAVPQDLQPGYSMWSDPGMQNAYNGQDLWYSVAQDYSTNTTPIVAIRIDSAGYITDIEYCNYPTCINYTIGGYDIGETTYLDCDGIQQTAYYNGPSVSGFDATSFCAIEIISYYGSQPYSNGNPC